MNSYPMRCIDVQIVQLGVSWATSLAFDVTDPLAL
jgi:hypothetical protein